MSSSSPKFTPTTTETESTVTQGPTYTSGTSSTTTQNNIPSWLEGVSQSMVQRANELSKTPYVSYGGERVAEFDPMMLEAFNRIQNQGVAGQIGSATDLAQQAGLAGVAAGAFDPYATGQFTGDTAQQYMNPYVQSVLDIQQREAQREADIAATARAGAAARAGAFGGSRQAIMDAEAARNLATQKGDIQAVGLQKAYESALQQFNTEQALREQSRQFGANLGLQGADRALNAAQVLGALGQTQFQQEMDITQGLGYAGSLKQAQEQAELDVAYQDFLAEQKYPYEQIAFLQGITAGAPHSTTQISNTRTSGVTTPGAQTTVGTASQFETGKEPGVGTVSTSANIGQATGNVYSELAQGGIVGYAEGGITGLLSDQQLQQRQRNQNLPTIARLAAEMQARENAQMRQAAMAQAAQMQGQRPTVAEEAMAGLDTLPVPDDLIAADGGVMALAGGGAVQRYQEGGETYVPFYEQVYRQGEEEGSIYDPDFGLDAEERAARAAARDREADKPLDEQAAADREFFRRVAQSIAEQGAAAGRAGLDIASLPARGLAGAVDTAIVRPMRAAGVPVGYLSPKLVPEGADLSSMTPYTDIARSRETAPNQSAAESARLLRASEGLPAIAKPDVVAPPAPAPKPDLRDRQGVNRTGATQLDSALGATPEARAMGAQGAAQAGAGLMDPYAGVRKSIEELGALRGEQAQAEVADAEAELKAYDEDSKGATAAIDKARMRLNEYEEKVKGSDTGALLIAGLRGLVAAATGKNRKKAANLVYGLGVGLESWVADNAKANEALGRIREENNKLDAEEARLRTATGKERRDLQNNINKLKRSATTATKDFFLTANIQLQTAEAKEAAEAIRKRDDRAAETAAQKELITYRAKTEAKYRPPAERVAKIDPVILKRIEGVDNQIRAANSTIEKIVSSPYASNMQSQLKAAQDTLATLQSARDKLLGGSGTPAPGDNSGGRNPADPFGIR